MTESHGKLAGFLDDLLERGCQDKSNLSIPESHSVLVL